MAGEHALMTQKTFPVNKVCSNTVGIEKGTLLVIAPGGNTVIAASAAGQSVAGIAYTEKIASDGNSNIAVLSGPGDELKAVASGAISKGDALGTCSGAGFGNYVKSLSGSISLSGSVILGYSTEDVTAGNTFKYVLNITPAMYTASMVA